LLYPTKNPARRSHEEPRSSLARCVLQADLTSPPITHPHPIHGSVCSGTNAPRQSAAGGGQPRRGGGASIGQRGVDRCGEWVLSRSMRRGRRWGQCRESLRRSVPSTGFHAPGSRGRGRVPTSFPLPPSGRPTGRVPTSFPLPPSGRRTEHQRLWLRLQWPRGGRGEAAHGRGGGRDGKYHRGAGDGLGG